MSLNKSKYSLTEYTEKIFFTYENLRLLIHPFITNYIYLLNNLER